jgi:hypothetical protein
VKILVVPSIESGVRVVATWNALFAETMSTADGKIILIRIDALSLDESQKIVLHSCQLDPSQ